MIWHVHPGGIRLHSVSKDKKRKQIMSFLDNACRRYKKVLTKDVVEQLSLTRTQVSTGVKRSTAETTDDLSLRASPAFNSSAIQMEIADPISHAATQSRNGNTGLQGDFSEMYKLHDGSLLSPMSSQSSSARRTTEDEDFDDEVEDGDFGSTVSKEPAQEKATESTEGSAGPVILMWPMSANATDCVTLFQREVSILSTNMWLNDNLVDYIAMRNSEEFDPSRTHSFSTHFYKTVSLAIGIVMVSLKFLTCP